jgi:hypothetical protein
VIWWSMPGWSGLSATPAATAISFARFLRHGLVDGQAAVEVHSLLRCNPAVAGLRHRRKVEPGGSNDLPCGGYKPTLVA